MSNLFDKVSITALIVIHFFICGGLYVIAFWTTFDFDVTNYIEVMDIPKSFVLPLAISIGFTLINFIGQTIAGPEKIVKREQSVSAASQTPLWMKVIFSRVTLGLLFIIIAFVLLTFNLNEAFYGFVCLCLFIYVSAKLSNIPVIYQWFPSRSFRIAMVYLVLALPMLCFLIGKLNGLKIFKNDDFYYIERIEFVDQFPDSIYRHKKLLGNLGQHIFLSDSANSYVQVLNLENVRDIRYHRNEKHQHSKNKKKLKSGK